MPIVFKVAESSVDKEAVFKLRHRVFVEQEQRFDSQTPHIVDIFDSFKETFNIIALKGEETIGAIRVVLDNPVGLPAAEHYNFSPYVKALEGRCACFGWLCTLKEYRSYPGLLVGLFKMAVHEMRKNGTRHVIATLHPPLMRLLHRSFNAKRVGDDFTSAGLKVPMTPALLSFDYIPPRSRELFDDDANIVLQDSSVRKIFHEGETITRRGEKGDEAFLILRGSARVLPIGKDGRDIFPEPDNFERIGEGDFLFSKGDIFGELSLLDLGVRTTTIIPYSSEVDVMVWSKEDFMKQLNTHRNTAMDISRLLGSRLRRQIQKEGEVSAPRLSSVARILFDASDGGKKEIDGTWLARQCGLWPENVRETTAQWVIKNIVSITAGSIQVTDPKALLQISQADG